MEKGGQVIFELLVDFWNFLQLFLLFRDSSHDGGKEGHRTGADSAEAVNIIIAN